MAEQAHQQDLERLKSFRYMDDDFMTACLADNFEGVKLILQIVLGKKDIKVKSVHTQEVLKNLWGVPPRWMSMRLTARAGSLMWKSSAGTPGRTQKGQGITAASGRAYIKERRGNGGHSRQLYYFYYGK